MIADSTFAGEPGPGGWLQPESSLLRSLLEWGRRQGWRGLCWLQGGLAWCPPELPVLQPWLPEPGWLQPRSQEGRAGAVQYWLRLLLWRRWWMLSGRLNGSGVWSPL